MPNPPKRPRQNRTITVDFGDEATYNQLCRDGKGFIDFVVAFILSIGFQTQMRLFWWQSNTPLPLYTHPSQRCNDLAGSVYHMSRCLYCLTPLRLTLSKDEARGCQESAATHGGLSLELCAMIQNVSPMAIYRLVCSVGRSCLVKLLTRCHLPLPEYFIAEAQPLFGQTRIL